MLLGHDRRGHRRERRVVGRIGGRIDGGGAWLRGASSRGLADRCGGLVAGDGATPGAQPIELRGVGSPPGTSRSRTDLVVEVGGLVDIVQVEAAESGVRAHPSEKLRVETERPEAGTIRFGQSR